MTQTYRNEILKFLSCCLDVMLQYDKDVIVIEQGKPKIGKVYASIKVYDSIKVYKTNPDMFIGYLTPLSDKSYKILYDNIVNWLEDIYSINVIRDDNTHIRIQFNSENFNREAIERDIQKLKQTVTEENPSIFNEDIIENINRTGLKVTEQEKKEERRTMIDYTMDTAEKIINAFVSPCLEKMLNSDEQPHVIILPQKRDGLGYVFDRLDDAKRHNIDELGVETFCHEINSDKVYQTLFDNMGQWVKAIPEIKVCHLKNGNLRIRFEEDTTLFDRTQAVKRLKQTIRQDISIGTTDAPLPRINEKYKEKKGEEKRMNSFSLTNLKDALVNKITHLDKKTITILALIALVLLVIGKYQDIKDILIGIKDKVKRSKNFKAMVADGTAAIDSLKKIVGVKDNKETTNEA